MGESPPRPAFSRTFTCFLFRTITATEQGSARRGAVRSGWQYCLFVAFLGRRQTAGRKKTSRESEAPVHGNGAAPATG